MTLWQKLWFPGGSEAPSYLIVGLGNPGTKYDDTRHNAGFEAVRRFATEHGFSPWTQASKYEAVMATGLIDGVKITLLLPQTFMNVSGRSVAKFLRYAATTNLIVVHDDLDLPFGGLRLSHGRGAGGHNGVTSIMEALGRSDFTRLRLGLGRPGDNVSDHVLSSFTPEEKEMMGETYTKAAAALLLVLQKGLETAMGEVNRN